MTQADDLRTALRRHFIMTAILLALLLGLSVYVYLFARHTRQSLCTFRSDLQARADQAEHYLREHPEGFPGLGITADQMRLNIANQKAALKSLDGLNC